MSLKCCCLTLWTPINVSVFWNLKGNRDQTWQSRAEIWCSGLFDKLTGSENCTRLQGIRRKRDSFVESLLMIHKGMHFIKMDCFCSVWQVAFLFWMEAFAACKLVGFVHIYNILWLLLAHNFISIALPFLQMKQTW